MNVVIWPITVRRAGLQQQDNRRCDGDPMKKKWRYKPMATPVQTKPKQNKPMATKITVVFGIGVPKGWLRSASAVTELIAKTIPQSPFDYEEITHD